MEKKQKILGQTSVTIDSYQKQGEVSPYYAEKGDALFEKLQAIIDGLSLIHISFQRRVSVSIFRIICEH